MNSGGGASSGSGGEARPSSGSGEAWPSKFVIGLLFGGPCKAPKIHSAIRELIEKKIFSKLFVIGFDPR